jgi:hypothetical protein
MSGQDTATLPPTRLPRLGRVLDPLERSSEIMFDLIMALTFTCERNIIFYINAIDETLLVPATGTPSVW